MDEHSPLNVSEPQARAMVAAERSVVAAGMRQAMVAAALSVADPARVRRMRQHRDPLQR